MGSIVYNNGTYYKSIVLHSYEDVSDDSFWQNLGNYESAIGIEPLLKRYSINNQYDNIFDINFGNTRNQLINYEVTPLNTLFDISFDDFTITDNLDLSKDNISWSLSPYWKIIPDFYNCELENGRFGEQTTGYVLFNMIGRFGENSSGGVIELDSNDLPLENNSKQAVLVRYNTSHIEYSNYNIIDDLKKEIANLKNHDGITFSGGDPMFQVRPILELAKYAKELGLNTWCYTGFTFEQLLTMTKRNKSLLELLNNIDC